MTDISKLSARIAAVIGDEQAEAIVDPVATDAVDAVIAAVAQTGGLSSAKTPAERDSRRAAWKQAHSVSALAKAKPKRSRADAVAKARVQLKAMDEIARYDAIEAARAQGWSEDKLDVLEEALEELVTADSAANFTLPEATGMSEPVEDEGLYFGDALPWESWDDEDEAA